MTAPALWPFQLDAVERLAQSARNGAKIIILCSPTGCHRIGQEVITSSGQLASVQDIKVGDTLMGPDSSPRVVTGLVRGRGAMYEITPVKGSSFVVNEDHVLTLVQTGTRSPKSGRQKECRGGSIVDVSVKDWLTWSDNQKHIHKLFRVAASFPACQPPPIDPYIMGVLIGDGSLAETPSVTTQDSEIAAAVHDWAYANGLKVRRHLLKNNAASTYAISSGVRYTGENFLAKMLQSLRMRVTSGQKFIPDEYKFASLHDRLGLLAGLIDTDGHLGSSCFDYITKSWELASDVAFVARSVGLAANWKSCSKSCQGGFIGTYWRVSISGDTSIIPCRVPRKVAQARRQIKNVLRTGFMVRPAGTEDFYGFSLDGDGRYLLDDFTVTHNSGKTTMACEVIRRANEKGSSVLHIAHLRKLVDQFSQRLDQFGVDHGVLMRGHPHERGSRVQVSSRDTLLSRVVRNEFIGLPPANLVVVDEGRHAASPEMRALLKRYEDRGATILLLDATPVTSDGRGLGPWAQDLIEAARVSDLVKDGFLVPMRCYAPDRKKVGRGIKRGIAGDLVESWKRYAEDQPTVLFTARVQHSMDAVNAFIAAGINAAHVDADTTDEMREMIFDGLANGMYKVVSNVGIIREGVDIPALGCTQIYMEMNSRVSFLQACGRSMRRFTGNGILLPKHHGILIDHAGAVFRHGFPDEDTNFTLEGNANDDFAEKHKKGLTEKALYCGVCQIVYKGEPDCPQCGAFPTAPPKSVFAPPPVEATGELLSEAEREKRNFAFSDEAKLAHWWRCMQVARKRNGTLGMAAHVYRQKYNEWPPQHFPHVPSYGGWKGKVKDVWPEKKKAKAP